MNRSLSKKAKKIKFVLTDVDGVLTDGGMYYNSKGDTMKKFHTRDGMGVTLLRKKGINVVLVTKEKNEIIKQWAKKMKVKKLYDGVLNKEAILEKICKGFKITPQEVSYIGDDINDLGLLSKVGFSATPSDGIDEVKKQCDYVCKNKGGNAAFREIADIILSAQKNKF